MLLTGTGRLAPVARSPWAIRVEGGRIAWVGDPADVSEDDRVDVGGALVTPGLVDSHTHPVFAGDRADEAAARLDGTPYSEGGILRTMRATRAADDETLEALVEGRLSAALASGTTTVECKSGYGLSLEEELRHLRLLRRVAARLPIRVITTFLGAHAVPPEAASMTDHAAAVADEMIPAVAAEGLADFVDVFADAGFFDLDATERIARAASAAGLGVRIHAEQLARTGAAELGARLGAASVDHLEQLDDAGVAVLAASGTVATLLPGPAIVLRDRMPPARALLDAGATVALASDANAGTFGALRRDAAGDRAGCHAAGHVRRRGPGSGHRGRRRRAPNPWPRAPGARRAGRPGGLGHRPRRSLRPPPRSGATAPRLDRRGGGPSGVSPRATLRGMDRFDLVVVGAGAAGEAAAQYALARDASVAVVDRGLFGGSCPFFACMPSKSLLHAAAVHHAGGDYPVAEGVRLPRLHDQSHRHRHAGRLGPRPVARGGRCDRDPWIRRRLPDRTRYASAMSSSPPTRWCWPSGPSAASPMTCPASTRRSRGPMSRAPAPASCRSRW